MTRLLQQLILITLIICLSVVNLSGQVSASKDTLQLTLQPIPVMDVVLKATEVNTILREKRTLLLTEGQKLGILARQDSLLFRLAMLRENPRVQNIAELNQRSLDNLHSEWTFLDKLLDNEQTTLNRLLKDTERERAVLGGLLTIWTLTKESVDAESAAKMVHNQINERLIDIKNTQTLFETESKFIQEVMVKITSAVIFTNELLEEIDQSMEMLAKSLFSINSPPLWKEFSRKQDTIVFSQERSLLDDSLLGIQDFYNQYNPTIRIHIILTLIILIIIFIAFKNLSHSIPESDTPEIEAVKRITHQPLAAGWLVSLILTFILYPTLHDAIILIVSFLLLPPLILILRALITGAARKYIYFPLIAMTMVEIHRIGYTDSLLSRFWLMLTCLFGIVTLALIFGRKQQRIAIGRGRIGKVLLLAGFTGFFLLIIALFSSITGAMILAEYLTRSVIESANVALFLFALTATLNSVITIGIYSNYLKRSSILSQYQEIIYKRLKGLIGLFSAYLLINFTFRIFTIWVPFSTWIKAFFSAPIKLGSMEFSLWNIFLFFFILWLTIWISRIIRTIFENESVLRDRMRRGAPGAVSLLLRISVITIGFMIAIAAAGVHMDKLAFLLGAFGVGIGFGLQNIFNNLVSGIILAFERPIKEGDIIEVGALLGIVKEIGIRSSIIRTYDGSEVIVPNGNLISNELINWTRSDMRRRGEVLVGVAYGTDPQKVIDLLTGLAKENPKVMNQPEPNCLFLGFGDSSLNFRLLFWMEDAELRLVIQSEMAVLVNNAIKQAGIEIPFPQRDLHVRSIDPKIMERIKVQDEITKKQMGFKPSDEKT